MADDKEGAKTHDQEDKTAGGFKMSQEKNQELAKRDELKERTRGEMIAAIRASKGYSQEELEWRSGVSKTQIGRIERDAVANPGIGTIRLLEKALDVPLMDLFVNPEEVDQLNSPAIKQPGTLLNEFEKKISRAQMSYGELKHVLERAMSEVEEKLEKKKGGNSDGTDRKK